MQGLRCPFSSPRAPGSVTHNSKDVSPSRAARKLSRRPGWSQPAAPRLQVAGQRRGRLSGQGPRLCHSAPGDPGVGSTRGPFCHSPTPWSASRVSRGSACARVFKPPAGESTRGRSQTGPPPRARAAGSGRRREPSREDSSQGDAALLQITGFFHCLMQAVLPHPALHHVY